MFDDGDERTLKRSSLCLKGARHFHESESLDNQPLTDPENFGAPVNFSKKSSRKRRRLSPGFAQEDEMNSKRKCAYPAEFPVGKVSMCVCVCVCVCVSGGGVGGGGVGEPSVVVGNKGPYTLPIPVYKNVVRL